MSDRRSPAPRRSPVSGGYARGEETRARIVQAALKVFGEEGYERASTRQIAAEAGVTPPALQYYFDSKEGLHRACAQFILDRADHLLSPALQAAQAVLDGRAEAMPSDALCDLLDAIVDASLLSNDLAEAATFSVRIRSEDDSPAGALIREKIGAPILDVCTALVARATASPVDDVTRIRASLLLSQVAAFYLNQRSTLAKLGWPDFDGPRRAAVKRVVRVHTKAALKAHIGAG